MTKRSADGSIVPRNLPRAAAELSRWDGQSAPADSIYAAMLADLRQGARDKTVTRVGQRLNYEVSGFSGLFRKSARRAVKIDDAVFADPVAARAALLEIDKNGGASRPGASSKSSRLRSPPIITTPPSIFATTPKPTPTSCNRPIAPFTPAFSRARLRCRFSSRCARCCSAIRPRFCSPRCRIESRMFCSFSSCCRFGLRCSCARLRGSSSCSNKAS